MISEPNKTINLFRNSMSIMRPQKKLSGSRFFPSVPQQVVWPTILFYRLLFYSLVGKLFKDVEREEAEGTIRVHREKEDISAITLRHMWLLPVVSLPFSIAKL
jgi:hypothetical protein